MPQFDVTFVGKLFLPDLWSDPMPGGPIPHPEHPIAPGGPPPRPTHPIYYPPGIWGGGGVGNYPDAGFPGPHPPYPPRPTHPIYYPPTGIWGGGGVGNYP